MREVLENRYSKVIIRENKEGAIVIKNLVRFGDAHTNDNAVWQYRSQEKEQFASFEEALESAKESFNTLTQETDKKMAVYIASKKSTQVEKSYKSGWVFYRLKELYGYDWATELLEAQL